MKINFKIFFSVGLLFESYIAHEIIEDQESVTCRQNVCDHSPAKNESNCSGWERGVEESITGAAKVLKRFPGPTFDIGETVITSYKTYTDELGSLTKCNSTFLSIRCTSTLEVLSLLAKLGKTPTYLLYQFGKVLPKVSSEFRSIVRNLSGSIGALVEEVNEVITAVERSINRILKQFQNRFVERQHERCEKIDFEECIKCAQMLTNTVALIAETALNDCDCVTYANEAYEAIAALTFILNFYLTGVQAFDPLLAGIAKAISSITFDIAKSMREYLSQFVNLAHCLNESLAEVLGPFKGAKVTAAQIKANLVKS